MDINQLTQLVKDELKRPDHKFSLDTRCLQSVAIDRLSDDFLPDNKILLNAASIEEPAPAGTVIVHGQGVQLPFTGMTVSVYFSVENNDVRLKLIATGDESWKLSTGFPLFGNTFVQDIVFLHVQ